MILNDVRMVLFSQTCQRGRGQASSLEHLGTASQYLTVQHSHSALLQVCLADAFFRACPSKFVAYSVGKPCAHAVLSAAKSKGANLF